MGKKQQMKKLIEHIKWKEAAKELARDVHENHFSTHWGWEPFDEGFLYYNNHPNDARPELLASIRAWLAEQPNLSEVAFASYNGEEEEEEMDPADPLYDLCYHGDDYTVAMIIKGPAKAEEKFHAAMERLHREWYTRLLARDRVEPEPVAEVIDIKRARSQVEVSAQVSALVDSVKAGE